MSVLRRRAAVQLLSLVALAALPAAAQGQGPKIHITFLWHMHQPTYWPGESVVQTDANGRYDYSVTDIHLQRTGPYTSWPWDAVQMGIAAGMPHFGSQVSFSGSLMENLDALAASGQSAFSNWTASWTSGRAATTSLGNPRLDAVAFGYHHPLMGLIDGDDIARQIAAHRTASAVHFGGAASRGIFPPENAFHPRMIPALVSEGIEWVLVDNIHFDRAAQGYPYNTGGNLAEPNAADQRNGDPGDWVSLNGLWAPTQVSGSWGHRPHYVQHMDPATGTVSQIVAVPSERYMGNEDGRGGFGALNYDYVLSQLEPYNTDPDHPLLVVLHHDGDNYGGGTDSYYHYNFQNFVNWLAANSSRFECTTIQDYLDRFPPAAGDLIHVEAGSWAGADNGDPEFKKWLGDVDGNGYSPDQNSWAVLTAASHRLRQARALAPAEPAVTQAGAMIRNAQASDYWYWDGSQEGRWDSHPTRAANLALAGLDAILLGAPDTVGPEIFAPQREPYNPGGFEWGIRQPSDFEVWTFVDDLSALASVTLFVREDADGELGITDSDNETYAGGPGVGAWTAWPMSAQALPAAQTTPAPMVRASRYSATVTGVNNALVDYYVEASDSYGHVTRSQIEHVAVGGSANSGDGYSMDGTVDGSAQLATGSSSVPLYYDFDGSMLYLATDAAATLGLDVFLVISDQPGGLTPAMWAKAGSVAAWTAFVGNESTNNWCGWFDQGASTHVASGNALEAVFDIVGELGQVPAQLFVSVLRFDSVDGGGLLAQFPSGNADQNVDAAEFIPIELAVATSASAPVPTRLAVRPNPFNPRTRIDFELPRDGRARLDLFDLRGRHLRTVYDATSPSGATSVVFDGRDGRGVELASGTYALRLSLDGQSLRTTKLNLIR